MDAIAEDKKLPPGFFGKDSFASEIAALVAELHALALIPEESEPP
jgi:hypothetical protein